MNKEQNMLMRSVRANSYDSNVEQIKAYIIAGGEGVELTPKQEELKAEIEFADERLREFNGKMPRAKIAQLIADQRNVSKITAFKYISWAEDVFNTTNPIHKAYRIQLRIEHCEHMVNQCIESKEFEAAAFWEKLLQKYLEMYPDEKKPKTQRVVIFNLSGDVKKEQLETVEAAMEIVSSSIKDQSNAGEERTSVE